MAASDKNSEPENPNNPVETWFCDQLPDDWFDAPVEVHMDRDEILVLGSLMCPIDGEPDLEEGQRELSERSAIKNFREESRRTRVAIALRAEALFDRKVSWAARCGTTTAGFTSLSTPVMTRLRMSEREVLDTLVAGGVARSRSDALGWCVRLVAENEGEWIGELRDALSAVENVRSKRR